ncbi:MAG: type 1 glutamine amidotransferase, partial [Thiotrichales bacterium]|nr:type 1 glutamine amidotransferase [Thiotrichales bacterium]
MKPVRIFRHIEFEGPGYLGEFLTRRNIPFEVIAVDQGDNIDPDPGNASALVFMGGPMSVNDELDWIDLELNLIRNAYSRDIPMLGHCLGGQLISRALGAEVIQNPVREIGW